MLSVERRNGTLIPFDPQRIFHAIFNAAQSVGGNDQEVARLLSNQVIDQIRNQSQGANIPVENIQDCVEKVLIEAGHAKTAKAYILYRAKHTEIREKKQGVHEDERSFLEEKDIRKQLEQACKGLEKIQMDQVLAIVKKSLFPGASQEDLEKSLVNAASSLIEQDNQYSFLASRLLFQPLYRDCLGIVPEQSNAFGDAYKNHFTKYLEVGIYEGLLDPQLETFDLNILSNALIPERDYLFPYRGAQTLKNRYLLKRPQIPQAIFELPQFLWMRVAMGIALAEPEGLRLSKAIEFYGIMSQMLYVPSTPTLFNSGTTHSQLSSCFLNIAPDSLEGIFKTYSDNAKLSKYAGGIGTDWTPIRSLGSSIRGTNGSSQGVIPFLKIFNDVAVAVNQGGKRKGAMCAYLEMWHGDLEEFLEAKKNTGDERRRLHDVHTAVWIPDLFMKRVKANEKWTLFSPSDVPGLHDLYGEAFEVKYREYEAQGLPSAKSLDALSLWRKTLTMLYETGHPWITFKDACNIRNPQDHCGVIHSSNLCTEITLNTSDKETAVCNLGSLNMARMIEKGKLNEPLIAQTVKTAIRLLDNVIDVNYYPTPEAKEANFFHRPIGLGVMGYQDALYQMGIPFASSENVEFADQSMEVIAYHALTASSDLALERGIYRSYSGSKWERGLLPIDTLAGLMEQRQETPDWVFQKTMDWNSLRVKIQNHGMRNSNCLAIAPTATISNIAGCFPCVEPAFRNIYTKENTDGSFLVVNRYMSEELQALKSWDKRMIDQIKMYDGSLQSIEGLPMLVREKYKEAFEIEPHWILEAAARRSKWIDQSASTNIFLSTTSGRVLHETYMKAWELGLKTTYYLRSLSISQVTKTIAKTTDTSAPTCAIDTPDCEVCQ